MQSHSHRKRVLSSVVEHGIADPAVTGSIPVAPSIRHGVVGNISACHADARGSIPRVGVSSISLVVRTPRCGRGNPGSNPGWGKCVRKLGLVGYDARLTRERSRVRSSELVGHVGRVVKAYDSKSYGIFPRRFKSDT